MYPQSATFEAKRGIPVRSGQKRQKSKGNEGLHRRNFTVAGIQGVPFSLAQESAKKKLEKAGGRF